MTGKLAANAPFPRIEVARLGGGTVTLGQPREGYDWQMIVVYRGKHCPICHTYLAGLEELLPAYHRLGIDVVAVSADPEDKARAMSDEHALTMPIGHELSLEQMAELGLYVSEPRSPQETDRPFAEPGVFVVNAAGSTHIADISNAPFARPDLEKLLSGLKFIREKDYPVRGTLAA